MEIKNDTIKKLLNINKQLLNFIIEIKDFKGIDININNENVDLIFLDISPINIIKISVIMQKYDFFIEDRGLNWITVSSNKIIKEMN